MYSWRAGRMRARASAPFSSTSCLTVLSIVNFEGKLARAEARAVALAPNVVKAWARARDDSPKAARPFATPAAADTNDAKPPPPEEEEVVVVEPKAPLLKGVSPKGEPPSNALPPPARYFTWPPLA